MSETKARTRKPKFRYVLRHKPTGRFLNAKSKKRWGPKTVDAITTEHLDEARVFPTLSGAHNCDYIAKDVDISVFWKDRVHTGDRFEYEAVPVTMILLDPKDG